MTGRRNNSIAFHTACIMHGKRERGVQAYFLTCIPWRWRQAGGVREPAGDRGGAGGAAAQCAPWVAPNIVVLKMKHCRG